MSWHGFNPVSQPFAVVRSRLRPCSASFKSVSQPVQTVRSSVRPGEEYDFPAGAVFRWLQVGVTAGLAGVSDGAGRELGGYIGKKGDFRPLRGEEHGQALRQHPAD
jgi:hypothetical protein